MLPYPAVETFLSPFSETTAAVGPWFLLTELQTGMRALPPSTAILPGKLGGSEQSSTGTAGLQLRLWALLSGSGSLSLVSHLTTPQPPSLDQKREHMHQAAPTSLSCMKGLCNEWSVSPCDQRVIACYHTPVRKTRPSQTTLMLLLICKDLMRWPASHSGPP